jgi:hypothetical protein
MDRQKMAGALENKITRRFILIQACVELIVGKKSSSC